MKEACKLCGRTDQNLKTDHLRECYKIGQNILSKSQYRPVLFYDEINTLQMGSNIICNNRKKCRSKNR